MSDQRPEWAFKAAEEVLEQDWDKRLKELCDEHGGGPERNVRAMIKEAADIIARHAPAEPTAIGPGDVVQFKVAYTPPGYALQFDEHSTMFNAAEVVIVDAVQMGGAVVEGLDHDPIPFDVLTRIGRAEYWPDGSLVKGGGE